MKVGILGTIAIIVVLLIGMDLSHADNSTYTISFHETHGSLHLIKVTGIYQDTANNPVSDTEVLLVDCNYHAYQYYDANDRNKPWIKSENADYDFMIDAIKDVCKK
jgi:hypothetical protein